MPSIIYREDDATKVVGPGTPLMVSLEAAHGALINVNSAVVADVPLALAAATGRRLLGFIAEESAGIAAAAEIRLRHGGVAGDLIEAIKLAADGLARGWWSTAGIAIPDGLSIDWISGQADINLFYSDT